MNITFNYLEFKNILSFGNKLTRINFENGMHLISGKNGSGKSSSLLDTLSYCLFGTPYRKIKIEELLNRKTKKNLEVSCNFTINNINYTITRGLKPNKLTILENGVECNLLSSKKLNNEEIEAKIGINYKMFKQIISLSINHNEPFLDMKTAQKREITDELFNITILTKIDKNLKEESKDLKIQKDLNLTTIGHLNHNISNLKIRLSEAENIKKDFQNDKDRTLNTLKKELTDKSELLNTVQIEGTNLKKEISNFEINDNETSLTENINKLSSTINYNETLINKNNKDLKFLNSNTLCPTCKSTITEQHKNIEILNLQNQISEYNSIIENSKIEKLKLQNELQIIKNLKEDIISKKTILKLKYEKYKEIQNDISNISNNIKDIETRTFNNTLIPNIQNELQEKLQQLDLFTISNNEIIEKININQKLNELIMDNGFKSYIYEQLIPILNFHINEYLKLFELPVNIEFDNNLDANIKTIVDNTNNVSYYCFSEGEKKRIDIAILLSFINVTKSLTNWNCNLLVIDELLDSSIDDEGLDKLLLSLEKLIYSNTTGIYIISHKVKKEYVNQFKSFIELNKNKNNYSELIVTSRTYNE